MNVYIVMGHWTASYEESEWIEAVFLTPLAADARVLELQAKAVSKYEQYSAVMWEAQE